MFSIRLVSSSIVEWKHANNIIVGRNVFISNKQIVTKHRFKHATTLFSFFVIAFSIQTEINNKLHAYLRDLLRILGIQVCLGIITGRESYTNITLHR